MLKPLVMYPSLSVTVTEQQDEGVALALQCLEESSEERSAPSQVYSKLLLVLKTLHTHLLGTKGVEVCGDYLSCCQTAEFLLNNDARSLNIHNVVSWVFIRRVHW